MLNQYVGTPCGGDVGTSWFTAFQVPSVPPGSYVINGMIYLLGAANGDAQVRLSVDEGRGRPQVLWGTVLFAGYGQGASGPAAAWPSSLPVIGSHEGSGVSVIGPVTVGTLGVNTISSVMLNGVVQLDAGADRHLRFDIRQVTQAPGGLIVDLYSYLELRPLD